ncbi:DUF1641 domain-containing protein [Aquibacillus salsiterrae]|uniref:DUF1641 domain-containing protein n=1 Tax=Aquibacillus salsiterrae TaxID=2950439 RepID=A0A9X4AF00_9BACI|nr:DUF1641 domain-containing protein [Aquibacillus salsiterrae]MDC3417356.1 DUF1641 domain-containing protein [Aquibacillus salsiterrae]
MARAITHINRKESNVEEERANDLSEILKQIAENREAIESILVIVNELHKSGALDIVKSLLRTREKVGVLAMEQINQPAMHHMIKNVFGSVGLLSELDPDQLQALLDGLTKGIEKASQVDNEQNSKPLGLFSGLKTMKDPNIQASLKTMIHFLEGMGESFNSNQKR